MEDNIKWVLQVECGDENWIFLTLNRVQLSYLVKTIMILIKEVQLLHGPDRLLAPQGGFCSVKFPAVLILPIKLTSSAYESLTQAVTKYFHRLRNVKLSCVNTACIFFLTLNLRLDLSKFQIFDNKFPVLPSMSAPQNGCS